MKKSAALLLMASAVLGLSACASPTSGIRANAVPSADPAHNSRNSVDWAGTYRGVLPCADCEGIETTIRLTDDGGYSSTMRYMGRDVPPITEQGRFAWDESGGVITLAGKDITKYRVGENQLFALAHDGSRITGALANHYVLKKVDEQVVQGIQEKYWKLVELNGRPVPQLDREPHMILKAEGGRVNGFAGCNGFTGTYSISENTMRIKFSQVASTMMACSKGMDVEQEFHKVLEMADNFSVSGDRLNLNKARMATLARFEAVYLK